MIITAHSGCDGTAPNSREFLEYALSSFVDAVEVDVRADGNRLILSHDADFTDPVTLREAFQMLKEHPEKKMNCDLKSFGLEKAVYDLAKEIGTEKQLIYTGDVTKELFRDNNCLFPDVLWYANISMISRDYEEERIKGKSSDEKKNALLEILQAFQGYRIAGLNWYYEYADLIWEEAKAMGIGISVWTVSDEKDLDYFLAKKPDNITTKNTAYIAKILSK